MSAFTVIADVGETLVNVLWEEIQAETDVEITDLIDSEDRISLQSPFELRNDNDVRLSVYLYRVVENAYLKNRFPIPANVGSQAKPPLTLDLSYMITPLLGPPREQHIVLGKVMQAFYDRAILGATDLAGSLAGTAQELHLVLNPGTLEEATRVWQALDLEYRLCVCYEVRVSLVDSRLSEPLRPVVRRDNQYAGV